MPKVKALDNVVKCRLILPPELPDSWSAWNAAHPKIEPSEVPQDPPLPGAPLIPFTHCITAAHSNILPDLQCYALLIPAPL